jgi:DNA-binding transcriptional ArsR family regulator
LARTDSEALIYQPSRLRIMAALVALPGGEGMSFAELKDLLELTDGNLSSHLSTLEGAGYVSIEKGFVGKRPRTWAWATSLGRDAFARCVDELESIIAGVNGSGG